MLLDRRLRDIRAHEDAFEIGATGWILFANRNVVADAVMLVAKDEDLALTFEHGPAYKDHLRSYCRAAQHAENNPREAKRTPSLS